MASTIYQSTIQSMVTNATPKLVVKYPTQKGRLFDHLKGEFERSRLTFVLGAGVSEPSGLPSWSTVTKRLTKRIFQSSTGRQVVTRIQRLAIPEPRKMRFLEQNAPDFPLAVRDAIYERYDSSRKNRTLIAIAKIALAAHTKRRALNIITYNVDDLVEEHLDAVGLQNAYSVVSCDKSYRAANERICVYHPHGFLPRGRKPDDLLQAGLVFSERQYHDTFFDHTYWPNMIQRTSFTRTSCLFIGCSLNDPNQRRLLDQSRNGPFSEGISHVSIFRKSTRYKTSAQNEMTDFIITQDVRSLGVEPYWIAKWETLSPTILKLL